MGALGGGFCSVTIVIVGFVSLFWFRLVVGGVELVEGKLLLLLVVVVLLLQSLGCCNNSGASYCICSFHKSTCPTLWQLINCYWRKKESRFLYPLSQNFSSDFN